MNPLIYDYMPSFTKSDILLAHYSF